MIAKTQKTPIPAKTEDQQKFDGLLRQMLSTPPKPRVKQEKKKTGK